jgi:hypothetical protein
MDTATLLALVGVLAFAGFVVYKVKQSKNKPKNTGSSKGLHWKRQEQKKNKV